MTDSLRQALRELGYIEGQNLVIEPHTAEGRAEQLPALAAELVGLKVDVIVTTGTQAALAARATAVIPISPGAIDAGFEAASKARADALIVFPDPVLVAARAQIIGLAAKHRLPTVYVFREDAEAGGLISYGASVREQVHRAATFVDKILKGAKSADLPVEQARTFELVVNARTAKALGLTLPQALLLRADHIIE